jgi:hypothetical protein
VENGKKSAERESTWNIGMLDYWNSGYQKLKVKIFSFYSSQPIIPVFQEQ